jgi:pyridoxine kinase
MRRAAREIHSPLWLCCIGQRRPFEKCNAATDIFFDGKTELLLHCRVKGVRTHGTGCTYSAAICAALALGYDLPESRSG